MNSHVLKFGLRLTLVFNLGLALTLSPIAVGGKYSAAGSIGAVANATEANGLSGLRIVILPFKNITRNANDEWLSDSFAESLTMGLLHIDALQLIERSQLQQVMKEQQFSQTGYIDESTAPQLGKLLGAKVVVLGSYQKVGDQLQANVRFVDVETGRVDAKKAAQVEGDFSQIFALQKRLATSLIASLDVKAQPEEMQQVEKTMMATLSPEAYRYYMEGVDYLRREGALKQADAIKAFQKALIEDANYAQAYAGLAEAYARRYQERSQLLVMPPAEGFETLEANDEAKAEEYARKALALNPKLPQLYRAMAYLKQKQGDKKQALEMAQQAVKMNPKDVDSLMAYLSIRFDDRMSSVPIKILMQELEAMGANLQDPWLQYTLGVHAFSTEAFKPQPELEWVRQLFESAALKLPNYPYIPLMIGSILYREEKAEVAQAYFDRALKLGHDNTYILLTVSSLYNGLDRADEALALVAQAEKIEPNAFFTRAARADALYAKGKRSEAEALYDALEAQAPNNTYLPFNRGIQYFSQEKNYSKARLYLQKALNNWEKHPAGLSHSFIAYFLGLAYFAEDNYTQAQSIFESLREDPVYYGQAYELLARIYIEQKNYAAAITAYTAYLTIDPEAAKTAAVQQRYRKYYLLNQLAQDSNNVGVLNDLGQIAGLEEKPEIARDYYERALALAPENAVVHYNLGSLALSRQQAKDALPHLQAAVRLKPDYIKAWHNLGLAYQSLGQTEAAEAAWQKVLQLDPTHPEAQAALNKP
jgi:tetratricopeptide (TPR) repeat protein